MTNAVFRGKPDAGNPHVRFDEGEVALAKPRRGSLAYNLTPSCLHERSRAGAGGPLLYKKRLIVAAVCFAVACCTAIGDEPQGDAWVRVFGMYCVNVTKSTVPEFPFYAQTNLNAAATSSSANAASPDLSALDAADRASLPAKAFEFTGYVSEENENFSVFTTPTGQFRPGATYRLNVYVSEPYQPSTRSSFLEINGARVKDEDGNDFWFDPSDINQSGTKVAKKAWKMTFDVQAKSDGSLSWGLPRRTNKSALNVVTVDGTNAPTKPTLCAGVQPDTSRAKLSWGRCTDALGYVIERKVDDGAWTACARTLGTSYEESVDPAKVYVYRVAASNDLGVAWSNEADCSARRAIWAVHMGRTGEICGRFVSAASVISPTYYKQRTRTAALKNVPPELAGSESMMDEFAYLFGTLTFTFTNLAASTEYDLRFWTYEPWADIGNMEVSVGEAYRRVSLSVNGTVVEPSVSAFALAGHVIGQPVRKDFKGTTDADGNLVVTVKNVSDQGVVLGLEVLEPPGAPLAAPPLAAYAAPGYVRLVADPRANVHTYEYECQDPGDAAPRTLFRGASAGSAYDMTVPADVTRSYRARIADADGTTGPWSEWVSAARGGRVPDEPLRVNHTWNENYRKAPPPGWVDGMQFLASTHAQGTFNSATYNSVDFDVSRVADPPPQDVYRTQFYTTDNKSYAFTFPGFDPALAYRVRVHMAETWAEATAGTRTCRLAVGGGVLSANELCDVYVQAGSNHNAAVVYEMTVHPMDDGTIRLDVVHLAQNATLRGTEIIPLGTVPSRADGAGVKTAWYAGVTDVKRVDTPCVAEENCSGCTWTAADVPATCASSRTRLLAEATLFAPIGGTYTFTASVNGIARVWVDDRTCLLNADACTADTLVTSKEMFLEVGSHRLVLEYVQGEGVPFAASFGWAVAGGVVPPLADCLAPGTASFDLGDWCCSPVGAAAIPSYARCLDRATGAWRLAGSGYDMWGGSNDGTMLYRKVNGTFDVRMRVMGRGGAYVANTRFGLAVRSTLAGALGADDFLLYGGVNGNADGALQLKGYCDCDGSAGSNLISWWTALNADPPKLPVWIHLSRSNGPNGTHRYVCGYSRDGEEDYFATTQDVRRVSDVYVGPHVMAHTDSKGQLAWMDVDGLEFVDTSPKGFTVFIR